MLELRLYLLQRVSAAILAPLVLLHLGVMIYAIQGGLSADEILARTRGSLLWGGVYGLFVLAVALHAAIGVRNILAQWWPAARTPADVAGIMLGLILLVMGMRAVAAVVGTW